MKKRSFLPLLIATLLLAACSLPSGSRLPDNPLAAALERKSGLIAYVGMDGNIYTIDQSGGNERAITQDAHFPTEDEQSLRLYQSLSWSPNSQNLAFVRIHQSFNNPDENLASVMSISLDADTPIEAFSSPTEIPFYLYWSPDNSQIGFLTNTSSRSSLILQRVPALGGDTQVLDVGAPYYWVWAPDSQRMAIHAGGGSTGRSRMSFLNFNGNFIEEIGFPVAAASFQTPTWSPDGNHLLVATQTQLGTRELVLTDIQGTPLQTLLTYTGNIAFGFSPDGQKVAAITGLLDSNGLLRGKLSIIDVNDPEKIHTTAEDTVMAFFWAPDNNQLAYFAFDVFSFETQAQTEDGEPSGDPQTTQVGMTKIYGLHMDDLEETPVEISGYFRPSTEFLAVLRSFDQYQHSATIWSPDSRYLVVPNAPFDRPPEIWIVVSTGAIEPRRISDGVLAFWSWE